MGWGCDPAYYWCAGQGAVRAGWLEPSADPVYRFTADQIRSRVREVYPEIISEVSKNSDDYVWESIRDVEHLGTVRMEAMELFFNDYEQGKQPGRYIDASLPELPFEGKTFDLALPVPLQ